MKTTQKINSILVCIIFIAFIPESNAQNSPCPGIFQYIYDGVNFFGEVTIPSAGPGRTTLQVKLGVKGVLSNDNSGQIDLSTNESDVINIVSNGGNLKYKITFPQSTNIPQVISIKLNNREYCDNTAEVDDSKQSIVTNKFIFSLPGSQNNAVPPPQKFTTPLPLLVQTLPSQKPPQPQIPSFDLLSREPINSNWLSNFKFNSICGTKGEEKLEAVHTIINGFPVQRGEYPWLVAVFLEKDYICSASLITDLHVVTAAHCTTPKNFLTLQLGKHNLETPSEEGVLIRFSQEIHNHPGYQVKTGRGDISVIRLNEPVTFSEKVKPICIWPFDTNFIGEKGTVAGWGQDNSGSNTVEPMQVEVDIVDDNVCTSSNNVYDNITGPDTFCAGGKKAGPCYGDSGSGMIIHRDRWYLRGVISVSLKKGVASCNVDMFAVYCDVGRNLEFLKSKIL